MIWLILGICCFLLFRRFTSKLEIRDYSEWKPFELPIWAWILIAFICLLPLLNLAGLLLAEVVLIYDIRSCYPCTRFKSGKNHWLNKLIDTLNRKI